MLNESIQNVNDIQNETQNDVLLHTFSHIRELTETQQNCSNICQNKRLTLSDDKRNK